MTLSAMPATYVGESHREQEIELVIIDFNKDTLVTPINGKTTALLTVMQKDCLTDGEHTYLQEDSEIGYMDNTERNVTWETCQRRT